MTKTDQLQDLLAPTAHALGLELLGIEYLPQPGGSLLRLYIDVPEAEASERSVGIDECEKMSREVSAVLDIEDPISGNYTLEVSSPGIDRPIFGAAQFARVVGENVKVVLKLPQDGRRRLQGRIARVEGSTVVFALDAGEVAVDAANIDKARLVPDWIALGMAPAVDDSGRDARPGKQKKKPVGKKPAAKTPTSDTTINSRAARKPSDAE